MARTPVPMPQLGVSVTEGTVTEWYKAEGDQVRADEPVCEISTDKVDTDVTAPADGTLARIVVAAGETVAVGATLAELASDLDAAAPAVAFDHAAAAEAVVADAAGRILASPVARRLASEHDIALEDVSGSGRRGRIRKADVLAVVERAAPPPPAAAEPGLPRGYDDVPYELVQTSHLRRAIAEHMVRSRHTAAHMTTEVDVDMHAVARRRAELNARGGRRLSYLPFVARAATIALREFPDLNATWDDERLIRWQEVNLGIAVDTDRGLMVPVIRRCERLAVDGIAASIEELARRARERRLEPDDMRAGTFTITNPGSAGAVSAPAIINQPQVAILGMPVIVRKPTVVRSGDEELVAIRPIMRLALTFDHRAVDGAEATRCAVRIRDLLEAY